MALTDVDQPATSPRSRASTGGRMSAAGVLIALGVGYVVGTHEPQVTKHVGVCESTRVYVSCVADGDAYSMPEDVAWVDDAGTWHSDSPPACLPIPPATVDDGQTLRFGTVEVNDLPWRLVVWVSCAQS